MAIKCLKLGEEDGAKNIAAIIGGVDKTWPRPWPTLWPRPWPTLWPRPWPTLWPRSWPTLWPTLWPTGGRFFKHCFKPV